MNAVRIMEMIKNLQEEIQVMFLQYNSELYSSWGKISLTVLYIMSKKFRPILISYYINGPRLLGQVRQSYY